MKSRKPAQLLAGLCCALALVACPKPPTGPVPSTVYLTAADQTVRLGATTTLQLAPKEVVKSGWCCTWSATRGSVKGSGSTVTYTAPAEPGFDVITVTAAGDSGEPVTRSVPILAFKQFVIIKSDDYVSWSGTMPDSWKSYFDYLVTEKHIKNSVGMITACLDPAYSAPGPFVQDTIDLADTGYVEFWFHGYLHNYDTEHTPAQWTEFSGTTYEYQKEHIDAGLNLAREYLLRPMTTVGMPYDLTDENTTLALNDTPEVTVCFTSPKDAQKLILSTPGEEVENPVGSPSFEIFLGYYKAFYDPNRKYTVLQFHPGEPQFPEYASKFHKIIDYLIADGVTFILPQEYYQFVTYHLFPLQPGADSDGDGAPDTEEGQGDSNGDGIPDFLDPHTAASS